MKTMEDKFQLDNFILETKLLSEQSQREKIELAQFKLETTLLEKEII